MSSSLGIQKRRMAEGKQFLLVDIGNSYIKSAVYEDDSLLKRISVGKNEVEKIQNLILNSNIKAILISASGQSKVEYNLQIIFPSIPVFHLHYNQIKEIQFSYAHPENIGKDRIAAMIGAQLLRPEKNICVVQAGTCLTIDWLFKDGKHLGGTISPGVRMRFNSMHQFTAKLPLSTENELLGFIGDSTLSCLASGVIYGMVAEINFQFEAFKNQIGEGAELILSGGDVNNLAHRLKPSNFVVHDLVFLGMLKILKSLI